MLPYVRRCLYLALVCLLIVPLAVMAQEDLTETFISEDGLVQFQYPAGWVVILEEDEPAILLSNDPNRVDLDDPPEGDEVVLLMIPVIQQYPFFPAFEPDSSASDIAEILLDDFLFMEDDATVMPIEVLQVGPYSAAKTSAFSPFDELGFYILVLDGETYITAILAVAESLALLDAVEPTVLAIAETFVFTGDPSATGLLDEAGSISYGQSVTGDLQNPNGDAWTFTGNAGDVVSIALDSDDFDAYLELFDVAGNLIASDDDSGGSLNALISEFTLPANGTYTINARGFSSTARGVYTLTLTSGDPGEEPTVTPPGTISYGQSVSGDLQNPDGDRWSFSGNAGDVVSIALDSTDFDAYLELFGPDGRLVASDDDSGGSLNALISEFTLPATGTYSINARGFSTTARGAYTLTLTSGTATTDVTGPGTISYGQSVSGDLQNPDGDRWSFSGNAGDVVSIALDSDDFDAYLELFGPDGTLVASDDDSGGRLNALISEFTLPATGAYSINARGFSSSARGEYTLTLTSGTATTDVTAPGSISYGQSVSGDLQNPDGDRWSFSGSAGDVVSIALDSTDFDAYLELFGPDGTLVASDDDSGGSLNALISEFTLPATGTYSINARGFSSTARGVYTLTLTSGTATTDVTAPGSISYGQTVSGNLQVEDGDRWTFSGSAGDIITIALDSDDFDAYLELYDADDFFLTSDDDGGEGLNSLIMGFSLPADGTYTIVARGFGFGGSGMYTLTLDLFDATGLDEAGPIAYGAMVRAILTGTSGDRWTFNGNEGDIVTIALNSDAFDAFLELIDANGVVLTTDDESVGNLNSLISGFVLPEKGEYTILARAFGASGTGLYTLELTQVDPSLLASVGILEPGVMMVGIATTLGERWTYNGVAGERISMLVGSETDIYLEILNPDGSALFDTQLSYTWGHAAFDNVELPVGGEYTIIVRARRIEEWSDGGYWMMLGRPAVAQG